MIKYDVFISYSRKDKKTVIDFCEELSKAGISYWLDNHGISNGEEFKSVIVKAIEESAVFIFISSQSSNESQWTAKEIGIAVARNKHIIPLKLDNSPYNKSVEFDLINVDFVDYSSKTAKENATPKLMATIKAKSQHIEKSVEQKVLPTLKTSSNKLLKGIIGISVCLIGIFCVWYFTPKPTPEPAPLIETSPKPQTQHIDEFQQAKSMLNSNSKDSVQLGYDKMLALANNGNSYAQVEVGITNFAVIPKNDKTKEYRSDSILIRRKHLGMTDNNVTELDNAINHLTAITDSEAVCPEMYYILGMVYYNQRTKESTIKAMEAFNKSLELLNNGFPVSHGYYADDLRERQEANINNISKLLKLK